MLCFHVASTAKLCATLEAEINRGMRKRKSVSSRDKPLMLNSPWILDNEEVCHPEDREVFRGKQMQFCNCVGLEGF